MSEIKICANKAPYKVEPSHSSKNFAEGRKLESLLAKEAYLKIEIDRLEKELKKCSIEIETLKNITNKEAKKELDLFDWL